MHKQKQPLAIIQWLMLQNDDADITMKHQPCPISGSGIEKLAVFIMFLFIRRHLLNGDHFKYVSCSEQWIYAHRPRHEMLKSRWKMSRIAAKQSRAERRHNIKCMKKPIRDAAEISRPNDLMMTHMKSTTYSSISVKIIKSSSMSPHLLAIEAILQRSWNYSTYMYSL